MRIFVITVTYKGHRWYDKCFSSLLKQSIPVQVIVVDNASNDGTIDFIREKFPAFVLIESHENLGFGRANNIGIRYAMEHDCDYVFLLNQDAWLEVDTIEKLVDIHQRHIDYGILGPLQVNAEKTKVLDGVIQFLINPDNVNKQLFSDLLLGKTEEVYPVAEINAAAWLLPRHTLEVIGGFDPLFLHYGEDWNYLSRVLYHNLKVGLSPSVQIVHDCVKHVDIPQVFSMRFEKWLLQRASDILYPDSQATDMMRHYFFSSIKSLCRFKLSSFYEYWSWIRFLHMNHSRIVASRKQNKKVGRNWL